MVWKYKVLKNFNVNVDTNAEADANVGSSAIALPGLRPVKLKTDNQLGTDGVPNSSIIEILSFAEIFTQHTKH